MFEFSISKNMKKIASPEKSMLYKKERGNREGSNTFMSKTNCQGIEN